MKIKILSSASQDLIDGYWFYEKQAEGGGLSLMEMLTPWVVLECKDN